MPNYINYTFEDFCQDIENLKKQILLSGQKFDCIVGVVRGGAVPAVCLSHSLGIPLRMVCWSRYHETQPEVIDEEISTLLRRGGRILLVDDILDSGRTMNRLLSYWQGYHYSQISIAVLINNATQKIKPDFYGRAIDREQNSSWFNFWWESCPEPLPKYLGIVP